MRYGFVKVMAASPEVRVADTIYNLEQAKKSFDAAENEGANLLVLPELFLSAYSCGDLFYSDKLLNASRDALCALRGYTAGKRCIAAVGVPLRVQGKLYNCAAVLQGGKILGVVPKTYMPNYAEFYEQRQFSSGRGVEKNAEINICGVSAPFGTGLVFAHSEMPEYTFGVEICEDIWAAAQPAERLCRGGAHIMINPSASNEVIGKAAYRRTLVLSTSARLLCGYIYVSSGSGESTQDMVFSRHHLIAENGTILAENEPFGDAALTISEIDVQRLMHERHRTTSYDSVPGLQTVVFDQPLRETALTRHIAPNPFVPPYDEQLRARAEAILRIQSQGLKKRVEHTHAKTVVLGISGGLDSTLALLVCVRAFDLAGRSRKEILCVTMPCFGTTKRTKSNAVALCQALGVSVQEVNITASVRQHFADIGHDEAVHDVTYENCQARERTQVLMDIANQSGGLVIGTGDLSELALGWATYNGDHMSMYAVNCSVPKTLVRYIVQYEAGSSAPALREVLLDILDTPVSPELLPADENGQIAQKTEDLVGPYELHDFFLYHLLRFGSRPRKLFRMAKYAYGGKYPDDVIRHWLKTFCRRFFQQQFKRSCIPDGPKVGSVTLSPRGDWRMPSDASGSLWLAEAEAL